MNSTTTFLSLLYPKFFIQFPKSKTPKSPIRNNLELMPTHNLIKLAPPPLNTFITLPNNSSSHSMMNNFLKNSLSKLLFYPLKQSTN